MRPFAYDAPPPMPSPWRLTPLLRAVIALHVLAVIAVIAHPALWPWALGAALASHLPVVAASLWPRSRWLGPNLTRLPETSAARGDIALTFDDGPDPEVTPAVLDLLDGHGVHATFFCIGERAAAHPELCQNIVRRGHAVENHSARHRHNFALLGPRGYARELRAAQQTLSAVTGVAPAFFRAPAGLRNPFLWPVLARHNLRLASWTRRGYDTRSRAPARVLGRLLRGLRAGDILLLHDGHAARDAAGRPVVLDVLPPLLAAIGKVGLKPVTLRAAFGLQDVAPPGAARGPASRHFPGPPGALRSPNGSDAPVL